MGVRRPLTCKPQLIWVELLASMQCRTVDFIGTGKASSLGSLVLALRKVFLERARVAACLIRP